MEDVMWLKEKGATASWAFIKIILTATVSPWQSKTNNSKAERWQTFILSCPEEEEELEETKQTDTSQHEVAGYAVNGQ